MAVGHVGSGGGGAYLTISANPTDFRFMGIPQLLSKLSHFNTFHIGGVDGWIGCAKPGVKVENALFSTTYLCPGMYQESVDNTRYSILRRQWEWENKVINMYWYNSHL